MDVYDGNQAQPGEKNVLVTIGTFDGVHLGHQGILKALASWRAEAGGPRAGVITFRQHPRLALAGRQPDLLTTLEHRLVLFERAGVDFAWVIDFNPELAALTARQFATEYLCGRLALQGLALGFNSAFGSDRLTAGSPALQALARELGFATRVVEPVQAGGAAVSSTRIRVATLGGRLREAEELLGRQVSVYGTVIQGDARGRRLGYNTANLDLGREVRPPFGVYATRAQVQGASFGSVTNVGYRPTITGNLPEGTKPDLLIETHLFDFKDDLYGQKMEVFFLEKLRDECRFPNLEALVEQIAKDEARARAILASQKP